MDKLRAELYALKMEMDRQRSRFKDEVTLMGAENEELLSKNEELKNDIRLNEEALAHATMQYNIQVASLRTEISTASASTDRERATREKLEAEIESLKTRLFASNQEMDKINRVRNELERDHRREKETWVREMERKEEEVNMLKDNAQHLNQRLHATDSKFNSMENELHVSNTSLMERTSQLQQIRQDLERQKTAHEQLDQNNKLEKDHNAKLQAKVESIQEKLSHQQHENLSLKQQMDSLKLSGGGLPGSEANEKLNAILTNLRADSERARASLEERNTSLVEQVARLKEEVRSGETRRATLEQELRRLHEEHSDMVKKLSHAEASLQMTMRSKDQLEQERAQLRVEMEKLQQRYQSTHDKSVEAQARVSELVDRLEKAEHSSLFSTQQLANTSANMQAVTKSKSELDESMQQLQIDNARLEAELKYEKQRADMLSQDLQDSQKVRSSLEALCANLKSSSAHLEEKLGEETASRAIFQAEAREHKSLWDHEIKSRSKIGLRIADLERNKQFSESRLGEEKSRVNLVNEEKRSLEARLGEEMEKNQQLQKDVNTLKLHLKSAKNKMKAQMGEAGGGDLRSELEARYRLELNRKLDDVNRFLDTQSLLRDRLDTSRTEAETNLLFDKRKLEEENNNLRVKYEQAVAQRETKEMEARRFRELYESEMKWRMRISDQLTLATDKGFNLKSKLNSERMHRNRLTGSIGNLNSSIVSNNSFEAVRVNGIHDDELSSKIKAELDRSIAKHLEAAPHNHNKPVLRPGKEAARFTSSFTQASHDYIDLLKRKYCV
ncbi:ankyrin repeat domain-containing protein 26 isoform X1 [Aplysia californica]|uniref:Ankyrin repeat domain-containing protein 26 isoform X1 n=1 Tax=Aplysia californica TaxID=6500 RepID=A0ABM1VY80_APLCA|nr:ankyrin repeat domain-containing protein 26 isoform X1 [Aplysia californica]